MCSTRTHYVWSRRASYCLIVSIGVSITRVPNASLNCRCLLTDGAGVRALCADRYESIGDTIG